MVAQIDAPAHDVGVVLKGGVGGEVGHKEHRAGAHWAGHRLGGRQVFAGDFEIPALPAGVVAIDAAAVRLGDDVQAAVFNGGIDEGNPTGHDQALIAVRHEIPRVLVPRHGPARVAGGLGADAIYGRANDVGADEAFDAGHERRVAQKPENGLFFEAAAAAPHDRLRHALADCDIGFEEGAEAGCKGFGGKGFRAEQPFFLQGGTRLVNDGGEAVFEGLQIGWGVEVFLDYVAEVVELLAFGRG